MKKVRITALKDDKKELLVSLQRCGELMLCESDKSEAALDAAERMRRAQSALTFAQRAGGIESERAQVVYERYVTASSELEELEKQIKENDESVNALESERFALNSRIELLTPWKDMDEELCALKDTAATTVIAGYVPTRGVMPLEQIIEELGGYFKSFGSAADGVAVLIIVHDSLEEDARSAALEYGLQTFTPPEEKMSAAQLIESCTDRIDEIRSQQQSLREAAAKIAENIGEAELIYDSCRSDYERAVAQGEETDYTVTFTGWAREDRVDRVTKAVEKVTDVFDIEINDPEQGETPPTCTKNNKIISQFETITDMFSYPSSSEVDPNPVMGPWYWLIYGMMMGDVGYGAVMLILLYAFKKWKKPRGEFAKLVNVMWYSGASTIIFGILFGSYFGATWHPLLFVPMDEPVNMLIFSLIIGVVHIFSGMAVKMYDQIRSGRVWDAIFDELSWMLLITGLGLLFLPQTKTVGMVMAIVGAAIVLCTAGRSSKNIIGKVTGGLLGLYNITGFMSDILSYSRILALCLSSGVVAMVMNMLAAMVQGSVFGYIMSIPIYIAGHAFNLVMGMLSAYVHSSRLQYIEFFGKFYEGGGYAFKPLKISEKYVDVIDEQ